MEKAQPRRLALAAALAVTGIATPVLAQMGPGGGGQPMPMAVDITKVAVGSWGEYSVAIAQMPPMKMKFALVRRQGAASTIEMVVEGGMMAMMGGRMAMAITSEGDPSNPDSVRKAVMQMGDNDPLEMPIKGQPGAKQQASFKGVDPKKLVGKEEVKVAAGSFKVEHYRDTNEDGAVVDAWVNRDVLPIGLVKMQITPSAGAAAKGRRGKGAPGGGVGGPGGGGPITFELTGQGKNAKPQITRPAKPFDQDAMMRGMMGGMRGPDSPFGPRSGGSGASNPAPPAAPAAPAAVAAPKKK